MAFAPAMQVGLRRRRQ